MTSTVPEPPEIDEIASSEHEPIGTNSTSDEAVRGRAWIRTLLVAMVAVGVLVTVALLGDNDASTSGADSGAASAATTDDGASPTSPTEGIFALPFSTIDGGTSTLGDYHGQPLVVNFFASWCPPCRAELPDFEEVHQMVGDEVMFVGVNQDFTEETWKSFVDEAQISYSTVFQPQSEIWSEVGTQAMPTTVFISADGEVQQVWAGLITGDKLEEVINDTLLNDAS